MIKIALIILSFALLGVTISLVKALDFLHDQIVGLQKDYIELLRKFETILDILNSKE